MLVDNTGANDANRAAEIAARSGYGRLLAILASQTRDISGAEDALSEAFASALKSWPSKGIPDNPDAWLLTAARRRIIDAARRSAVHAEATPQLTLMMKGLSVEISSERIPDYRLELMFMCAHPAIDEAIRTPLMLQCVLGIKAEKISRAFLTKPETMSQRLVRAKTKIKDAGIPFKVPDKHEWQSRLEAVLDAIYVAYTVGWDDEKQAGGLVEEAIWLSRLVERSAPQDPEAKGLLALILFSESRRPSRRSSNGEFIQLSLQDTSLWNKQMINEARKLMLAASKNPSLQRYQLEAAIQSVHARRLETGEIDWKAIVDLYGLLLNVSPSLGAQVAHAAAYGEAFGAKEGLEKLESLPKTKLISYTSYWAVKGHLLQKIDRQNEARESLLKAANLATDEATREWLNKKAAIRRA